MEITQDMKLLATFSGPGSGWKAGNSDACPLYSPELVLPRDYIARTSGDVTIFVVEGGMCVVNFGYDAEDVLSGWDQTHENWDLPARVGEIVPDSRDGQPWFQPFVRYEYWTGHYELTATWDWGSSSLFWEMVLFSPQGQQWDESFIKRGTELRKMLSPLRKLIIQQPATPVRNCVFKQDE